MGLVLGSFLSVIVFRLDNKKGIVSGRSECPECLSRLKWYDLVPLLSYFYLRGKCRYCKIKISAIYPVMEATTGSVFGLYCFMNGPCFYVDNFYALAMIFVLLALLFFDYVYLILPDKMIILGLIAAFSYMAVLNPGTLVPALITGFVLSSFFAILYLVSWGQWIGFGDAKLAFLIGFVLGYPNGLWSVLIAVWAGAIWGMGLILLGKANLKTQLPFGSFMAGAAIILIIFEKYDFWNILAF